MRLSNPLFGLGGALFDLRRQRLQPVQPLLQVAFKTARQVFNIQAVTAIECAGKRRESSAAGACFCATIIGLTR